MGLDPVILIALGANLSSPVGPPEATFAAALEMLTQDGLVRIQAHSRIYRSPAWPDPREPEFRNAVARLETSHSPASLLARLHEIEAAFGRVRIDINAPRPLDMDLLDFEGRVETGSLSLPHPRLHERAFVLLPLREVAPDWHHPVFRQDATSLIAALATGLMDGVEPV